MDKSSRLKRFHHALEFVSELTGVSTVDITSKSRQRDCSVARHFLRYFLRTRYNMSYQGIAWFTNSNHATIIHSVKYVEECARYDKVYRMYKESVDKGVIYNGYGFKEKVNLILNSRRTNEFKSNELVCLLEAFVDDKLKERQL